MNALLLLCSTRLGMFRIRQIVSSILLLGSCLLHAQDQPLFFQRISLEQGLSQTIVGDILQDRRGFMWFSSEDGLNKYDGYTFTVMRNDPDNPNSLSHNNITCLFEDKAGILWVGTNNGGLNRYDPNTGSFIHYRHDPNDPHSISNDVILAICEDRYGTLWIGTADGLNRIVKTDDKTGNHTPKSDFQRYFYADSDRRTLQYSVIYVIHCDTEGNLWIGTNLGISLISKEDIIIPHQNISIINSNTKRITDEFPELGRSRVIDIHEDHQGILWIGMDTGLYNLIPSSSLPHSIPFEVIRYKHDPRNSHSLSHDQVYAIYEDRANHLWIGTNGGGMNIFDRESGVFIHYVHDPRNVRSISSNEILSIYEDRSGNLWIGTYGRGINKIDRGRKRFTHNVPDPENTNSLSEAIVFGLYEDKNGVLWIGTHGGGLNKLDRKTNRYTHYRANPDNPDALQSNYLRCIIEDSNGFLWIGTNGEGIVRFDRTRNIFETYRNDPRKESSISDNIIRSLFEDRTGTIWVGTFAGGLSKMISGKSPGEPPVFKQYRHDPDNPNSISSNFIRIVYQDRSGNLWIGTYGGGLTKFDPQNEIFTHFRADNTIPNSLSNDYVFTIHEDKNGILWLGTWGGGLNRFDPATGFFKNFTDMHGLPNNAIYGILEDDSGNLWLSTNNGISRFDTVQETFRNFKTSDGLQSREFNGGAYYKSPKGEFFFGGVNGFNTFYPDEIHDNTYIPPVVITSFKKLNREVVFDKPVTDIREIKLSYRDYVFSFEFAALDYTVPDENLYAYKMEGLDPDWFFTDARKRFANYTTLPPGKYTFRVKASNNDGVWNEEGTSIALIITPPYWKTWWFIGMVGIALFSIGYVAYTRRLKTIGMQIELQTAHDAQMSIMPHRDPVVPGLDISGICIPANEVGGDFFDYLWWDEGEQRIGIVVGDVSGKAMKAAMIAVMTSGMISAEASEQTAVHDILTRINRPLYLKTDKGVFVALCLAVIDYERECFCFSNAGLSKPILKSGGKVSSIEGKGVNYPLGMLPDSTYDETPVSLQPGDLLVIYTDGVSEARDHGHNFYTDERLYSLLETMNTEISTANEIKDNIIKDIERFSGSAPRSDDMTVVVVKVSE
jgi:ligand-binding sensor domain-containing protein